jgi:PASTA domain
MREIRTLALSLVTVALAGCTVLGGDDGGRKITIADLTGINRARAVSLIDNLDLDVRIVTVESDATSEIVLRQVPVAGTVVEPGSTLTLFVPDPDLIPVGEGRFRLLTHCGLSYPLEFDGHFWLPTNPRLRRTINAPEGFASHNYYDHGTIRRVDADTVIYTSSTGVEVTYEPTTKVGQGCD